MKILISGATGGIGEATVNYLASLGNDFIFLVRNTKLGTSLKEELEKKYPVHVDLIPFDYFDKNSIKEALITLKSYPTIHAFINISGIYHQKEDYSQTLEKTYLVNYLYPLYFVEELLNLFPKIKIIGVSSLSYSFSFLDLKNIKDAHELLRKLNSIQEKTKRYALSKKLMMMSFLALAKEKNAYIRFCHPGISCTNLFARKNHAYSELFYQLVPPLMNVFFMKKEKASLSLVASLEKEFSPSCWIGPRGFFHAYGSPTIYPLKKDVLQEKENQKLYQLSFSLMNLL